MDVRYLQGVEVNCCVRIAMALMKENAILGMGMVWGTDCILSRVDLRSQPARTLSFAEVSSISREELIAIASYTHSSGQPAFPYAAVSPSSNATLYA